MQIFLSLHFCHCIHWLCPWINQTIDRQHPAYNEVS